MSASGLPFDRIGILAGLHLPLTATDQMHEFLRRRHIAAKFAALLRHRTTKACRMLWGFRPVICLQGRIDPQLITPGRMFRLAGFAGRGFVANVYVATTHDGCPLLRSAPNAQAQGKVAKCWLSRPDRRFGSFGQPVNKAVFVHGRRGQSGPTKVYGPFTSRGESVIELA